MLAFGCGNAERLLHQAIRLVPIAIRAFAIHVGIFIARSITIRRLPTHSSGHRHKVSTASLALHFSICQETPADSTRTPAPSVGPASHARFSFIPHEDGAGLYGLPFFLREASLYSRQQAASTCFEQLDGARRVPDVTSVCFHHCDFALKYAG